MFTKLQKGITKIERKSNQESNITFPSYRHVLKTWFISWQVSTLFLESFFRRKSSFSVREFIFRKTATINLISTKMLCMNLSDRIANFKTVWTICAMPMFVHNKCCFKVCFLESCENTLIRYCLHKNFWFLNNKEEKLLHLKILLDGKQALP